MENIMHLNSEINYLVLFLDSTRPFGSSASSGPDLLILIKGAFDHT